jgi:hypothetical protein
VRELLGTLVQELQSLRKDQPVAIEADQTDAYLFELDEAWGQAA